MRCTYEIEGKVRSGVFIKVWRDSESIQKWTGPIKSLLRRISSESATGRLRPQRDDGGVLEELPGELVFSLGEQLHRGVAIANAYLMVACMRCFTSPVSGMDASGFRRPDRMSVENYVVINEPQALLCLATGQLTAKLRSASRVFPALNVFSIV